MDSRAPSLAPRAPVEYTVEDQNATKFRKAKEHSIGIPQPNNKLQYKTFKFLPGKAVAMPQEIALLFLDVAPTFIVKNSLGQVVRPRKFSDGAPRTVTLRPHEVAVSVTQVLKPVLYEMARNMPGGAEKFPAGHDGEVSRQVLEEFIISGGAVELDDDGFPMLDTASAA